ncbi:MAG: carboxypeptidase regulatory-like domain-containing protein [bacterium]
MRFFLKNRVKTLLSVLFLLLLSNINLTAQKGGGDFDFMAQTDMNANGLYLYWFMEDSDIVPTQVEVWVEKGVFYEVSEMKDADVFTVLSPDQWTAERGMYQAYVEHEFESGYYTFYISATMSNGTVKKSNTSPVNFNSTEPGRYLEFTTVPAEKAVVGSNYSETVVAIDPEDANAEIEYALISGPAGMEIDKTTGVISWVPDKKGTFEVWIQAYSLNNPDVFGEHYYYLTVFSCQNPAILSGTITDSQDNPVSMGYIQLISENYMENPDNPDQYYAIVENGSYSVEADEGKYYLVFQDMYGYYEFYPGTFEIEKAELINVACADNLTYDMKLTKYKNSVMYTVTGSVKTENDDPIPYTNVMFEGVFDDEYGKSAMFNTITDEEGNYEVQLPDAYKYIAYVDAYWDPTTGISKTLYYNQTYKRSEAEILTLTGDLDGINFVISGNNDFKYYTVSGNVSKEDGTPVENATVVFEGLYDDAGQRYPYFGNQAMTDENGNYTLQLPELFNYKAYVVTSNNWLYKPLYYNQTYNYEEAEVITLTADREGIDFVLSEPDFNMYKISGKVTREDGTPIQGAMVAVEGFNDSPDYYYNKFSEAISTDSEGKYEIELPEIFKYVAYAFDVSLYDRYKCMMPMYYKQTYNPQEATILELSGDLSDIDFVFGDTPSDSKSSISGKVVDEEGNSLEGIYLMAYNVNAENTDPNGMYDGRATISNESGEFKFMSLKPGSYVLLAVPKTLDNVPGFYKEGSTVVLNADEATIIDVAEDESVSGITVILGALGEIQNADKGLCQVTGRIKAQSSYSQERISVSGAVIYIENSEGKIQNYVTSNIDGSFNLKNLPNDNLTIKVEKLGYQTYTKNISFDETQNFDVGEILLTPEPLSVKDGKTYISSVISYPNPAKDKLNISFESRTDNVQISLINSVGKMVWTAPVKTVRGSNNITLDVNGYASGAYFVIIDNGSYSTAYPVTIRR